MKIMKHGKLFILSAPSGTGKTTILNRVMANISGVAFSISHTTRYPRKGESDGVEYHFVDVDLFLTMRENDDFLEWAEVHGNYYGTSRQGVQGQLNEGMDIILDIDVQGAAIVSDDHRLETTSIFLAPPGREELESRLRGRGLDDEKTIITRLKNAELEMERMDEFDYIIINNHIDDAVKMFESILLAERARDRRDISGKSLELLKLI